MEEKMNTRQQQAAQTEERLRQAAARLFREKGYDNTKISDICREAGVSSGNFYHYFPSKDHLYLSLYASFDDFAEQVLSKHTYSSNLEAIRTLIFYQVASSKNVHPDVQVWLFRAQLNTGGGYVTEENRFIHTYMKTLLRQGIKAGEIDPSHNVERTAQLIFQVSRGILFDWAMRGGIFSKEEQINLALDLLLSSLTRPRLELPSSAVNFEEYDRWQENYYKEHGWE